ncbi:MAG: hypothetical protein ACRCZI_13190, partial [Cetobacterium sp.]
DQPSMGCYEVIPDDASQTGVERALVKAVLAQRKLTQADQKTLPTASMDFSARPAAVNCTQPEACPQLLDILRSIRLATVGLTRVRSYMREGRVSGLRGVLRKPQPSIAVALDVSGSISDAELQRAKNITEFLRVSGYKVQPYVFASDAKAWPDATPMPAVGSGTDLGPLMHATQQHHILVILSDGCVEPVSHETQTHIWVGPEAIQQHSGYHVQWSI